ncbi:MAG: hypothetical protein JNK85_18005 [Verrucomicrobiales bacterium]|nr:hypothetical protein [Verrucomicrobiales bacterium]
MPCRSCRRLLSQGALLAFSISAIAVPLKVACVGDSITEGAGLASPAIESYPARLQRLFGTNDYAVRNFGVSGRTLLKKGDFPYWKEAAFRQSQDWGPDVVIIKLGTNDSKPQNWRYGTNFVADYEELVGIYRALPSQPRVIVCTPAPVFKTGAFDIKPGVVATNIAPAARDLATRLGTGLIDFHTRLSDRGAWFPDTVHPNNRGAAAMAAIVFESLASPPPTDLEPELRITTLPSRRVAVEWPAAHGHLVLEFVTAFAPTGWVFNVIEQVPYSNGTTLRLTNAATTLTRFYRLSRP